MNKANTKIILIFLIIFGFVYPNFSLAADTVNSKILPITSNTYRKDPTAPKKAIKKNTDSSNTKTNKTISDSNSNSHIASSSKSSNKSDVIRANVLTVATSTQSLNNKPNNATSSKTEKTNSSEPKTKVLANSSIKLVQPQKVVQPKKLKEVKTSRKDRVSEPIIKVKLGSGTHTNVKVYFPNGGQILNSKGKRISSIKNGGNFTWTSKITAEKRTNKKKKIEYLNETLYIKPSKDLFSFNGNEYRGKLYLKLTEKGAIAVNEISIEDYLRGVVGREIGANSPDESLKAQSVIARTYAYANKGRHGSDGADVCNTTHCQVYFGKSAERESVDKAIKATRGFILSYNLKPISALYHATCGGMTSNNEDVWGGTPEPFLRRVYCNFCMNGTKFRWNQELTADEIRSALAKEGIKIGEIYKVCVEAPAKLDRVTNVVFQTSNGEQKVRGTTIRRIFNLPTTTFVIGDIVEKNAKIANAKDSKKEFPQKIQNNNILISSFSSSQDSPKQLLLLTAGGLKRAKIPEEGWKCISYNSISKGIALLAKNEDNKDISKNTNTKGNKKNSYHSGTLKPINKINLFGRGFGHQVGLCQSGAVEMGRIGWNYRQILAHYYKGVAIKNLGY